MNGFLSKWRVSKKFKYFPGHSRLQSPFTRADTARSPLPSLLPSSAFRKIMKTRKSLKVEEHLQLPLPSRGPLSLPPPLHAPQILLVVSFWAVLPPRSPAGAAHGLGFCLCGEQSDASPWTQCVSPQRVGWRSSCRAPSCGFLGRL